MADLFNDISSHDSNTSSSFLVHQCCWIPFKFLEFVVLLKNFSSSKMGFDGFHYLSANVSSRLRHFPRAKLHFAVSCSHNSRTSVMFQLAFLSVSYSSFLRLKFLNSIFSSMFTPPLSIDCSPERFSLYCNAFFSKIKSTTNLSMTLTQCFITVAPML